MNIAIIGLGGMGTVHYCNYEHIDSARVVAAVGVSESDRARACEWGIPLYDSPEALLENETIDLVDICVPTFLHKQLALQSLSRGINTLTEKPIALSLDDAKEMYAAADRGGAQLYVAQVLQFTPEVEILRDTVEDMRYGKPLDGCFERLTACPAWSQESWLFDKSKSGLIPFDLHIHDLDVIVSLFGKPKAASCTSCKGETSKYSEQYRFSYCFEGGLNINAEAGWFNACIPFTARWRVYFEHGMLVCENGALTGYKEDGGVDRYDISEQIKIETGINVPPTGMFLSELKHFVERAAENKPSERVTKEQVLAVLETLQYFEI